MFMIAMKRLMQTLVFAVVMLCQQEKAAMVLEPANNAQGVVLMGKGMGALQEQTDWYKSLPKVLQKKDSATKT
jgi:conjugal transfer/entry exclusion protein